ncbi:MAG TPA: Xaa-Pro peptidase family protein [Solirubrobacteraceae bacterium]|nr:Xaa-Pro peptidase family protein [Solirubrobacteraceae bacterium]
MRQCPRGGEPTGEAPPDGCRLAPRMAVALGEYRQRLTRTRTWMRSQGVELLLLTQPEHYNWLSGYEPTSAFYFQALVVPVGEDAALTLLCNKAERLLCEETCWVSDVRTIWTHEDQVGALMEALRERGLDGAKRVGVNLSSYHLKPRYALELMRSLPEAELVDACEGLDDLRLVKSPAEIGLLRQAARVADTGVLAGIEAVRAGASDCDVLAAIQAALAASGGEFPAYPTLVDARGTLHGTPIGKLLQDGDVVYLEVSGVVRRYHCNISRTVVVGEPSARVRELYEIVEDALHRATDALRPGTSVADIVDLVAECHRGYEQNTWGRFGFSMEIAYPPIWIGALSLMRGDRHTIEPGMVITMEPGLSYSDGATMMLGNNVLVTEDGPEVLNEVPVELFCK